jgi:hypothetical protein
MNRSLLVTLARVVFVSATLGLIEARAVDAEASGSTDLRRGRR